MSNSNNPDDDIPENFGTSLGGSVIDDSHRNPITCQVCGMSFPSYTLYQIHFRNNHSNQ
jgi:hypothetical protein